MELNISQQGDIDIIAVSGEIDAQNANKIQNEVQPLFQPGVRILMDMSGVVYISSAGLRLMLLLYRSVTENDGQMVLIGLSDSVQDTMDSTGFLSYFTLTDSYDEALEILQGYE